MTTTTNDGRKQRPEAAPRATLDHGARDGHAATAVSATTSATTGAPAPHQDAADKPSGSHRGRWVLVAIVLGIAAIAVARGVGNKRRGDETAAAGKQAADRPVPVAVATAVVRDVPIYLEGLGSVTAFKTVNVRAQVDGRLMSVAFTEGRSVKKGELLAQIDPRPFAIQLHQGEAALARDEAQLHGAERNLERYAAVSAEHLIPQQQTDDQRALVEQLRGTVQADRAQIESAKLMLDYARIVSPLDGVTGVRLVDPGNLVHAADTTPIVVLTQMDPIAVLFTLPEDDLPRVSAAQGKAPLVIEAQSRDGSEILARGALAVIDNQINQTTATMKLKAIFPNAERKLWPNQFVTARLLLDLRKGALVIPAVAVQRGPQGAFVYVLGGGGGGGGGGGQRVDQRPVVVESIQGDQAILASGVGPGERVVIEGQSQLRAGARVAVRDGASGAGAGAAPGARGPGGGKRGNGAGGPGGDGTRGSGRSATGYGAPAGGRDAGNTNGPSQGRGPATTGP